MMNVIREVIFISLSAFVIIYLTTISLTLLRMEKTIKSALNISERKILKDYGKR